MDASAIRIDKWLAEQLPDLSRSKIVKLIEAGCITIENQVRIQAKDILPLNTKIFVQYTLDKKNKLPEAKYFPLDIVFEDDHLIVINKPINLAVHPGAGNHKDTLVSALLYYTKGQLSDLSGKDRPGIVHRLDKDTSGLMVVCKNNNIHQALADQFKKHTIKRVYRALTWGQAKLDQATINAPIGRHPIKRTQMAILNNGKKSITKFRVLNRYTNQNNQPLASELELQLYTGRTHQIRVHLAYIDLPIIGDRVYNNGRDSMDLPAQALFSSELAFVNPLSNKLMSFKIEEPSYYLRLKNKLEKSLLF